MMTSTTLFGSQIIWKSLRRRQRRRPRIIVGGQWYVIAHNIQEKRHERCQKMRDKCDSEKCSKDEVRSKSLGKHEYTWMGNGEV